MSQTVSAAIQAFEPALPLAVAYSGGADSTALLLACTRKWPGQVRALHVHHGLQAAADDFVLHCQTFCAQLQVPLAVQYVDARHASGQSPEEAARQARYAAFASALQQDPALLGCSIALAQHADDQVETLLLALSRGAGLPGLSAMPGQWLRDGVPYYRPLLEVPGPHIRQWLQEQGVAWLTDPTNADQQYTRNRIRAQLLPALQTCFPGFRDSFARSAAHAAQAQRVLSDLAQDDLQHTGSPPNIALLRSLSRERQGNLLRFWLKTQWGVSPSTAQLEELLDQVADCSTRGHRLHIKVASGFVQRRGEVLDWYNP